MVAVCNVYPVLVKQLVLHPDGDAHVFPDALLDASVSLARVSNGLEVIHGTIAVLSLVRNQLVRQLVVVVRLHHAGIRVVLLPFAHVKKGRGFPRPSSSYPVRDYAQATTLAFALWLRQTSVYSARIARFSPSEVFAICSENGARRNATAQ